MKLIENLGNVLLKMLSASFFMMGGAWIMKMDINFEVGDTGVLVALIGMGFLLMYVGEYVNG